MALAAAATCGDSHGFRCDRIVEATIAENGENRLKINVSLGDVVSLELPERVELRGEPALGNSALFDVKVVADPLRILVWPKLPKGAEDLGADPLMGERSNLQVFLDSGVAILIELRIARPEASVQRVQFEFPQREQESDYVRRRMAEETRRLEAEYRERQIALERRIAAATRDRLAKGMLVHAECASLRERTMRDLVVLRADRICRIGSDLFISFSIQNRSRDAFSVDRVEVRPSRDESAPLEASVTFEGQRFLAFDQSVRGVAAWTLEEEMDPEDGWTLVAFERAGRAREVRIEEVGF